MVKQSFTTVRIGYCRPYCYSKTTTVTTTKLHCYKQFGTAKKATIGRIAQFI